jgi:hypothetical protein
MHGRRVVGVNSLLQFIAAVKRWQCAQEALWCALVPRDVSVYSRLNNNVSERDAAGQQEKNSCYFLAIERWKERSEISVTLHGLICSSISGPCGHQRRGEVTSASGGEKPFRFLPRCPDSNRLNVIDTFPNITKWEGGGDFARQVRVISFLHKAKQQNWFPFIRRKHTTS